MKNNGTVNKGMSNLTPHQKKIKKGLNRISESFIKKFQDELGDRENLEIKDFLNEHLYSSFDSYKAEKDQKKKDAILAQIQKDFKTTIGFKDEKYLKSFHDSIKLIFDKLIENLSRPEVTEMNYQVLRVGMIDKLMKSLHSNLVKYEKKEEVNAMITHMYTSLDNIGYSWAELDMRKLLVSILDIIEYSVRANYFEPDVTLESMSDIFLGTCEKFLTVVPAELMLYAFESRLKGKEIDQKEFDRLILKLKKFIDEGDNK